MRAGGDGLLPSGGFFPGAPREVTLAPSCPRPMVYCFGVPLTKLARLSAEP